MCYFCIFPGPSLSMSGSYSYALLTEPFTLTCTVSHADGLSDIIIFHRKSKRSTFASMSQDVTQCAAFRRPPSGYSVFCGSGTDIRLSTTKIYTLKIKSFTVRDATDWWCELEAARTLSIAFSLDFKRKFGS